MLTTDRPRLQPHDLDAERSILGAILLDPAALPRVQEVLSPSEFYDGRHRRIYGAMCDLAKRGEPIDLITLANALEASGDLAAVGGRGALAELLTAVASPVNIVRHSQIVHEHALRRRLIRLAWEVAERAFNNDAPDTIGHDLAQALFRVDRHGENWCSLAQLTKETVNYVDEVHKRKDALIGIPTGYAALDALLGGWQRSDLIVLAARPSMGKTSLALGSALAAAQAGYHVAVLSVEMSRVQVGLRLHGMGAPIDVHALKIGSLTPHGWQLFAKTAQRLASLPLWVDDSSVLSADQVAAKARSLKSAHGLDFLIIDYLQLLQMSGAETRQQGVADASRRLKLLAKELDIPVLVLSQLSRECERRDDKRPVLADLRDSGAIEQDADVVLLLYRHEAYCPETDDKGVVEVLVRKHRNGPIGDLRLKFVDRYARFGDLDELPGREAMPD